MPEITKKTPVINSQMVRNPHAILYTTLTPPSCVCFWWSWIETPSLLGDHVTR